MARRPSAPWDLSNGNQPIDPELTAISALASTGILVHTGAGTAAERTVTGTLGELGALVRSQEIQSPALLLIGDVVAQTDITAGNRLVRAAS